MMRGLGSVIILLTLGYIHWTFKPTTITIRQAPRVGISPVTTSIVPLTADDMARGLLANPTISIDPKQLETIYTLRVSFAEQQSEIDQLSDKLGQDAQQLLYQVHSQ